MQVKTIKSEQVWQSPDGQKTIWDVVLQAQEGKRKEYPLKTFSPRIAEVGYEGEVESYVNSRGDRFVKQLKQVPQVNSNGRSGYQGRDDNAIRAQWAIGQAIALTSATMDKKAISMQLIEDYAKQLFATVTRVKGDTFTPEMGQQAEQHIQRLTQPTRQAVGV